MVPTTTSARISLLRAVAGRPRCSIPPYCAAVDPTGGGITSTSATTAAPRTSTTWTTTTVRFLSQHGAKRGQHIQRLEEIATSQEHNAAVDRRRKKKEKETARKSGVGKASTSTTMTHAAAGADEHDDFDDDEDADDEEDDEEGPSLPDPKDIKERMQKQIEAFKSYLKSVRGSEPTAEMFDDISVADAYGKGTGLTPLKSVAQVVISSPTLATATCYVRLLFVVVVVIIVAVVVSIAALFVVGLPQTTTAAMSI